TIFSSFGLSFTPTLTSGAITIDNSFRLFIPDTDVAAGAPTELVIYADHVLDLAGFQISCVFDNSAFDVSLPLTNEGWTSGLDTGAFDIDFLASEFVPSLPFPQNNLGGFTVAILFDAVPPFNEILFASPDSSLVRVPVVVDAALGECPLFEFQSQIPTIELDNLLVTDDGAGLFPILDSPTICVVPPSDFRRGDANAQDGTVNIADAIFLLEFLFAGGLIPPCFPAADTNDDETLNIADAVSILGYLFSGDPPPLAPGPIDCGPDPTAGPSCATYSAGC
ncbi:MAG: dockerin type I repeat-containing protein, partial [Planctomycetota bacterium]